MKHLFIINPSAGKGRPLRLIPEIERFFKNQGLEYCIETTGYPGQATEIASRYDGDEYRIYSVGGDGTLNEIINGMIGRNSSLAVIPAGSGNDFFRSISGNLPLTDLFFQTVYGREELIDLGLVNGRYFINIASLGFDAEVAYNTQNIKKGLLIPSNLCYLAGVLNTLFRYRNNRMRVTVDGRTLENRFLLIAVANGRYYGGGLMPAPGAEVDDGLLDVCIITARNLFQIIGTFSKYIKGGHCQLPGVHYLKGKSVKVLCDRDVALNIDGEVMKAREAVFQIIPGGIKLVVPRPEVLKGRAQAATTREGC
ncbi:MAG: diacylglycerol/lipid kinase family protein [Bacillota bacterium]